MSVKALLDDAAAEATAGLRIDVRAAYAGASERRARARWRASAMMGSALVVAAVVALGVVALPAGGWLHRSASVLPGNGNGQVGLPDRWYGLNGWSPSLKRAKMPAASMVLVGASQPMLVSADGTRYAQLPWNYGDQQVALSADGRDVAWVSPGKEGGGKHGPVIHRLGLPDAQDRRATLPGGASQQTVRQVIWAGQSLYVLTGGRAAGSAFHTWRLDGTTGAPVSVCSCGRFPLGVDGAGHLRQPGTFTVRGPVAASALPGVPWSWVPGFESAVGVETSTSDAAGHASTGDPNALPGDANEPVDATTAFEAPRMVVSPDGTRTATVISTVVTPGTLTTQRVRRFELAITTPPASMVKPTSITRRFPVLGTDPITDVRLLGWSPAGLIVRVKSLKDNGMNSDNISIRLIAPDGGASRVISRAAFRGYEPVAVAPDVVGTGVTVPGREPRFSSTDRAHLKFLLWRAWYVFGSRATAVLLVVLGLGVVLLARHRRRVRSWPAGEED